MNRDDERLHDVYHVDLRTHALTLVAKNPGDVASWVADGTSGPRRRGMTPDGGCNCSDSGRPTTSLAGPFDHLELGRCAHQLAPGVHARWPHAVPARLARCQRDSSPADGPRDRHAPEVLPRTRATTSAESSCIRIRARSSSSRSRAPGTSGRFSIRTIADDVAAIRGTEPRRLRHRSRRTTDDRLDRRVHRGPPPGVVLGLRPRHPQRHGYLFTTRPDLERLHPRADARRSRSSRATASSCTAT